MRKKDKSLTIRISSHEKREIIEFLDRYNKENNLEYTLSAFILKSITLTIQKLNRKNKHQHS